MTSYDDILDDLAGKLAQTARRPAAGFYAACGAGLREAVLTQPGDMPPTDMLLLDRAIQCACSFASGGAPSELPALLATLEDCIPHGDAINGDSPQYAQDCWICVDTAVRIAVDDSFEWGPVIEYALEPVMTAATEELYSVSQLGSGAEQEDMAERVLEHEAVRTALAFCRWAIDLVRGVEVLSIEDWESMRTRASVLMPHTAPGEK